MKHLSLLRYALVCAFVLASSGFGRAQSLTAADAPAERGGLQLCVDDVLLVPDSDLRNVSSFDPATGDLVDASILDDAVADSVLSIPINAISNFDGDGIFVSDQFRDVVFEFDCDGNFVGRFAPARGIDNTILDNIRGITLSPDRTQLWVTTANRSNAGAVAAFDRSGVYIGNFIDPTPGIAEEAFDVLVREDDLLYGDRINENIQQFSLDGTFLGTFEEPASEIRFPLQIKPAANGNVLVASLFPPGGIFEYDGVTGVEVAFYDALTAAGGVHELPNGNLLVTNSSIFFGTARGISEITRDNVIVRQEYANANRFIELVKGSAGASIGIDASPDAQSVPQGGTVAFSYSVTNNTASAQSGVVFYEVFNSADVRVVGPRQVQAGTLNSGQTVTAGFSVGVPSNAPAGGYDVVISAGPSNGNAAATDAVAVEVTGSARPAGSATTWSLAEAQAWDAEDALGAAARTAELAAFPNPLRSETTIRYALAETAEVRLAVYDVLGRQVALLAEGRQEAGPHAATFDARGLATGTYVYRLQVGESVQTGRLTVVN